MGEQLETKTPAFLSPQDHSSSLALSLTEFPNLLFLLTMIKPMG